MIKAYLQVRLFCFRHQIGRRQGVKAIVMCYHYALAASPTELAARYRKEKQEVEDYIKIYHIGVDSVVS